jgi:hypothetical protein
MQSIARISARPKRFVLLAVSLIVFTTSDSAAAWFLPIPPEPADGSWSDIAAIGIRGDYDTAAPDLFQVTGGNASSFHLGTTLVDYNSFSAPFRISGLKIDSSGVVTTPGTLTIGPLNPGFSAIPNSPYTHGQNLLTGEIINVQFPPLAAPGILHMLFRVTGGTAQREYGGFNALGGIKLTFKSGTGATAADFSAPFAFNGSSTADTLGVVPEPTSIMMIIGCGCIGALFLATNRQRRSRTVAPVS